MEKFLSKEDVCEMLEISQNTLYRMISRHEIACVRVSGRYRFFESDVEQYIADQRIPARPAAKETQLYQPKTGQRGRPATNYGRCEYVPGMKVV